MAPQGPSRTLPLPLPLHHFPSSSFLALPSPLGGPGPPQAKLSPGPESEPMGGALRERGAHRERRLAPGCTAQTPESGGAAGHRGEGGQGVGTPPLPLRFHSVRLLLSQPSKGVPTPWSHQPPAGGPPQPSRSPQPRALAGCQGQSCSPNLPQQGDASFLAPPLKDTEPESVVSSDPSRFPLAPRGHVQGQPSERQPFLSHTRPGTSRMLPHNSSRRWALPPPFYRGGD